MLGLKVPILVAPGQRAAIPRGIKEAKAGLALRIFSTKTRGATQFDGTCNQGRSTIQSGSPCVRSITSIDLAPLPSRVFNIPRLPSSLKAREGFQAASNSSPILVALKFSL